jgi:hypothetical protein
LSTSSGAAFCPDAYSLYDEPQKELMQAMLAELRGMLDEFEEAYFGGSIRRLAAFHNQDLCKLPAGLRVIA